MFRKSLNTIIKSIAKSKRVIKIPKAKLQSVEEAINKEQPNEDALIDTKKIGWQAMNLSELASLSQKELTEIKYSITKFRPSSSSQNKLSQKQSSMLMEDLRLPYEYLSNQRSHPLITPRSVIQMYDLNLESSNQQLIKLIQFVYKNIHEPKNLYGKLETRFIRYLMGFNNDLKRVGVTLKPLEIKVKEVKPVSINYEFCVDVSRNRNKNQSIQDYIIFDKAIQNPNQSSLMKQHHNQEIIIKHIIKKRRNANYGSVLRINSLLQVIFADGNRHYIKIQQQGPRSIESNSSIQHPQSVQYQVIDIDSIMKGNPSISLPFNFD